MPGAKKRFDLKNESFKGEKKPDFKKGVAKKTVEVKQFYCTRI